MNKHHYFIVQILHLVVTILTAVGVTQNQLYNEDIANVTLVEDVTEIKETKEVFYDNGEKYILSEGAKTDVKQNAGLGKTRKKDNYVVSQKI